MQKFFPAVVEGSDAEGFSADVIGTPVVGQGETQSDALTNAGEILQEVIWDAVAEGEPVPSPGTPGQEDYRRGTLAVIQATLPAQAA